MNYNIYSLKHKLADITRLNLPTDRPRHTVQAFQSGEQPLVLSKYLSESLKTLSRQKNVTLFMTLLAAFQTLLYRYTDQDDIIVGSPHLNDTDKRNDFFINLLRTDLSGNPTFYELLDRVREIALEALEHQNIAFELEKLQTDLSRTPLFQVMFQLRRMDEFKFDTGIAPFDLALDIVDQPEELSCVMMYNANLFDANSIKRMGGHFRTLLEGIVANPTQKLSELPLLTEVEQHQLLIEWNNTQRAYPQETCIHHLFETQVEKKPDDLALVFENQEMSYRELNTKANQLAHYLQSLGVKPEVLVGICLERSPEMLIGLLGILKAGGAYLPLDPAYPRARLAFMLEEAKVPVLLTQSSLNEALPDTAAQVVCLDAEAETLSALSANNPSSGVGPKNLAYVIYTSGSTGKPKGVQIHHSSLLNFLTSMRQQPGITEQDTLLAITTISFDIAALELYLPLIAGAKIVLISRVEAADGLQLLKKLNHEGISIMQATPTTWQLLMAAGWKSSPQLKILCGGEALSRELATQLLKKGQAVWNLYGPTETTIWSTMAQVSAGTSNTVSIGRPIANTQIYILDHDLQLLPIGVSGELHIGGLGLSRGYLNRPDLTAEKFIRNPFSDDPDSRLYKTGDLARYLPDGNIEYLGRIDNQVKIRGFRIELGEIEAVLGQHPAVRETVVINDEAQPNDNRLIAYIVSDEPSQAFDDLIKESQVETVSQWQGVFDEYDEVSPLEPTFSNLGWTSSYTGIAIPAEELREWVDARVNAILSLQPDYVLEIGSGAGLLLSRIAPHCKQYWGADFSPVALRQIEQLKRTVDNLNHVTLFNRRADDFKNIEPDSFDTIVINSVIQYFPNVAYLLDVLDKAIKAVKPGGHIFIGDVRNLQLLKTYHVSVQLYQAPDSLSRLALQQRVQQHLRQEEELAIDPTFFMVLKQHFPKLQNVRIDLERSHHHNEFTRFRYDVILQVGTVPLKTVEIPWQDWQTHRFTLSNLRQYLMENQPDFFGLQGVPNARLDTETRTLEWLYDATQPETVGKWRETLSKPQSAGIDPEDLWVLSGELPYDVAITWANASSDGSYEVLFRHQKMKGTEAVYQAPMYPKPWHHYANNPLQSKLEQKLAPQLRQYLQDKLPAYMVPSTFVTLEALPLMPNGKIDRRALSQLSVNSYQLSGKEFVAPRTPEEERLAGIWAEVLGVERVGIYDNFFEMGGHSLLATQVMSRIRDTFSVEFPLHYLFERKTIARITETIEAFRITTQGLQIATDMSGEDREEGIL